MSNMSAKYDSRRSVGLMGVSMTSRNQGVKALGSALSTLIHATDPAARLKLFGSHPDSGPVQLRVGKGSAQLPIVFWRMSPRSGLGRQVVIVALAAAAYRAVPVRSLRAWIARRVPWIAESLTTEIIGDVRGGDSFSDIYGLKRFLIATLPVASVIWVKGSIVQFPQTYGPYKSWISRVVARWILRHSRVIVARDKQSQAVAQALVGPARKVLLSPDVAFALHAERPETLEINGVAGQMMPANAIGLNVNGLMYHGGYTKRNMFGLKLDYPTFLATLVPALLRAHDGPILLIPHTYAPAGDVESDNEACRHLRDSLHPDLRSRVLVLTGEYDCHQLKGVIGQCMFFVGSRMHSCIAALSQGVPCVGVAYSMKFRGVFESVGVADWVLDAREFGNEECAAEIALRYLQRAKASEVLASEVPAARHRLQERFKELLHGQCFDPHLTGAEAFR